MHLPSHHHTDQQAAVKAGQSRLQEPKGEEEGVGMIQVQKCVIQLSYAYRLSSFALGPLSRMRSDSCKCLQVWLLVAVLAVVV